MSPLPETKRQTEAREFDDLTKVLDMVFRTKSMVKALAKQYNLYIKDDIMINLELKANLTNQEQAVSRKKKINIIIKYYFIYTKRAREARVEYF